MYSNAAVKAEETRLALAEDISPPAAHIVSWKQEDWKWLQFFREHCIRHPDDILSKIQYKNYLRWYRSN